MTEHWPIFKKYVRKNPVLVPRPKEVAFPETVVLFLLSSAGLRELYKGKNPTREQRTCVCTVFE